MKKSYFNIFVEKLLKKKGKLLYPKDIESIIAGIMGEQYTRPKGYKLVHQAKNKSFLFSLKKDVYYIPQSGDNEIEIADRFYWEILHAHIKEYMAGKGIITGYVALQLLLQNFEIPEIINVISQDKQCVETIVRDKKISIKKMTSGKESLYNTIKKKSKKITIRKKSFLITSMSVSLLEAQFSQSENQSVVDETCKKVMKKYRKQIDWDEVISMLRKGKYHSSINKLYNIARGLHDEYAQHIMNIIKKYSYRMNVS